ncbi:helix-turn-helix domain-containing protein [Sphingobacterium kyonggiense]
MVTIGQKIKTFRTLKGLSQKQLAEKSNSHKTTISRIENDQLPPNAQVLATLSSYGMNIDELLTEEDGAKKEQSIYLRVSELEIKLLGIESKLAQLIKLIEKKL